MPDAGSRVPGGGDVVRCGAPGRNTGNTSASGMAAVASERAGSVRAAVDATEKLAVNSGSSARGVCGVQPASQGSDSVDPTAERVGYGGDSGCGLRSAILVCGGAEAKQHEGAGEICVLRG